MEKIHYKDILTKKSDCGEEGKTHWDINKVTCLKCLEIGKKEWERQVKTFSGQPKRNAENGLYEIKKRIRDVQER